MAIAASSSPSSPRAFTRTGLDALMAPRSTPMLGAAGARGVSLAALRDEPDPPEDLDAINERTTAWIQKRRHAHLDRARANRIIADARALSNHGVLAFKDAAQTLAATIATSRLDARRDATRAHRRADAAIIDRAFALATEAVRRNSGFVLHAEQVLAALALADDCCVELATGEGKTVTAVLPAALRAWSGRGVHVVTVNDYLARRDADTNRGAFAMLGLRVGVLQESSEPADRRAAYAADVTYGADKQFIFDFLRDRLAAPLGARAGALLLTDLLGDDGAQTLGLNIADPRWSDRVVQRGLHAAIIDEADSVLIDDSVTPAIISSGAEGDKDTSHLAAAARLVKALNVDQHYKVAERLRQVSLTDEGRALIASHAHWFPAFYTGKRRRESLVTQALVARELYELDRDYVICEGKIEIVDRSTGRVLPGRMWELGLHQAVEAKQGVEITGRRATAARSSYQGFFRRYARLCGMSGTCMEVGPEMWTWYRLPVVKVPTHKPTIREQPRDRIFDTLDAKFSGVVARVQEAHAKGQPVLVGTWRIDDSERLAERLREAGIPCMVLNAQREAEEATIVANAGEVGAVTVATNMAGRGTDIRLSPDALARGGLLVIATERHDERRVDRQLFGRSGRQGDPGRAETFVSLEDQLIKGHGSRPLAFLARRSAGPIRGVIGAILWKLAQANASRKWRTHRADAAKSAAWHDKALHHVTR
jgi:preprotein translocase subunit SecA